MPTRSGPIVFIRGADDLENVFTSKNLGKNASTWGVIDGAVDVSNLVQPMLVDTFFEWEGQRWQAARKDINPFFAHSEVGQITLETVLETMEHWSDSHETDFLNEAHNIVKMAVIRLLGGMKMDREAHTVLDEVMTYFLGRNTSGEIPVFNKQDSYMIKKITPFCKRVIEWNRAENNEDNSVGNRKSGLIANMIKTGNYTDQMIVNIFINLIVAGGETPALVCCKTLAGMIANPDVMEKAV
jgi:cytochrome P450